MVIFEIVFGVLIVGSIGFYGACAWLTHQFFSARSSQLLPHGDGVSILVPICGLDAGAWQNWTSLCEQTYSPYEVLFGVVDPKDPAVPVLHQLAAQYRDRVRVLIDLPPRGINHKDSTLTYLLAAAKYDTIIFADSDIRVTPTYINTVTDPLASDVHDRDRSSDFKSNTSNHADVVTCAFIAHDPRFLGSALASLSRCCDFIPSALIARSIDGGLRFAVGTTIACRRKTLEGFGGLQVNRIGSDYNLGKRAAQAGYRVELSKLVLESDTGNESIADIFQRELRWSRTIRFNRGPVYYSMIFCYGTVLCIPLLFMTGFAPWAIALTIVTWSVRLIQAAIAVLEMQSPRLMRWFWLLPLRDGLSFVIWAIGCFGREAYWRGRKLRIEGDGIIRQVEG